MPYVEFDLQVAKAVEDLENGYVLFLKPESSSHPFYNFSIKYTDDNAGVDLFSVEDYVGDVGGPTHLLDLGVRAMLVDIATREPVHFWLLPRSSIYKTGHMMANSVGVIDSTYRGVLKAPLVCVVEGECGIGVGQRYFQIVAPNMGKIHLVRQVADLPATERGEGGFGSTGA
jgi:dUTP pyrophosphatase